MSTQCGTISLVQRRVQIGKKVSKTRVSDDVDVDVDVEMVVAALCFVEFGKFVNALKTLWQHNNSVSAMHSVIMDTLKYVNN